MSVDSINMKSYWLWLSSLVMSSRKCFYFTKFGKPFTAIDLSSIKVIVADVGDYDSLKTMCSQGRVLLNCCGPYRLYGEPVVRAAIEAKTHYIDITGEEDVSLFIHFDCFLRLLVVISGLINNAQRILNGWTFR